MYYPAALTPYADGSGRYGVTFVDFPGCVTVGENLEDALAMATEALGAHLGAILESGRALPAPTSLADAQLKDSMHGSDTEKNLYQMISFEPQTNPQDNQAVRITISLKPAALDMIDNAARELGLTRSGFIVVAAREYCKKLG